MRPPSRRVLLVVAAALAVLTASAVAGVGYVAADILVHPPRDLDARTPALDGLAFSNVTLLTKDGLHLAGWWVPSDAVGPAPTVVFLHGYGASKVQSLSVAPFLHRAGYAVLAFDFRAHGFSQGDHTTVGIDEVQDVEAALGWLATRSDANASRVALFGWSMGAATALNAAAHGVAVPCTARSSPAGCGVPVRALVLDSPFSSLDAVAVKMLTRSTHLPAFPFATVSFAFAQWMTHHAVTDDRPVNGAATIERPLLVIAGRSDDVVGQGGEDIGRAAGPNATLWVVPGAGHLDALQEAPREYQARVLSFLAAHL